MLTTTEGEATPILIVRDAWLLDLGRKPYREVWELQKALVDRRAEDKIPDGLILVEHEPVATLGRRGTRDGFAGNLTRGWRDVLWTRPRGRDGGVMASREACLGRPADRGAVKAPVRAPCQAVFRVTFRGVNLRELGPEPPSGRRPRRP